MNLKSYIREVPDFPVKGILFYDITTLLKDAKALNECINQMYEQVKDLEIDKVASIESRGFIFGVPLALKLGCGSVIIRKPGKLPAEKHAVSYTLEYGTNTVEIHKDAIKPGEKVLIVDDLLATGGTMSAAVQLVEKLGAEIPAIQVFIELNFLPGREKLKGHNVLSILSYDK